MRRTQGAAGGLGAFGTVPPDVSRPSIAAEAAWARSVRSRRTSRAQASLRRRLGRVRYGSAGRLAPRHRGAGGLGAFGAVPPYVSRPSRPWGWVPAGSRSRRAERHGDANLDATPLRNRRGAVPA